MRCWGMGCCCRAACVVCTATVGVAAGLAAQDEILQPVLITMVYAANHCACAAERC
jgi:hypothetical protein